MRTLTTIAIALVAIMLFPVVQFDNSDSITTSKNVRASSVRACVEASDWYCLQGDAQHSGSSDTRMISTNDTAWNFTFSSTIATSPIVVDGMCYVATTDGVLHKLVLENGTEACNLSLGGAPTSPLSANPADGTVIVGLSTGELVTISGAFAIVRRAPLPSLGMQASLQSGALFAGASYFAAASYDNGSAQWTTFYKFDQTTGNMLNNATFSGTCRSTPAFDGTSMYVGIGSTLYCISQTLSVEWSCSLGAQIDSSPSVYGGRVAITAGNTGYLYSTSGSELWSIVAGDALSPSPIFRAGYVYFACNDGRLYVADITTGANVSIGMQGAVLASPVAADGKLYVACSDAEGTMQCFNATSNDEVWRSQTGNPIDRPLAVSGGIMLVPSGSMLYAFGGLKRTISLYAQSYMKYFDPGANATYVVYLKNDGNVDDDFDLSVSDVPDGWYVALSATHFHLMPGEIVPINFSVTAPDAREDETAAPLITATIPGCMSQGIRLGAILIVKYAISLDCIDPVKDVRSNATVSYMINMTNLGNIDETYSLTVDSYPAAWNPHLSTEVVHLDIGETCRFYLNVTSPRNALANETARIPVTATSSSRPAIKSTVITTTLVEPMYFMDIECALPYMTVYPDGNVTFQMRITNRGNDVDSATINATGLSAEWAQGWKVYIEPFARILGPWEFADVNVTLQAPGNATARSAVSTTINATSTGNTSAFDYIKLTAIVLQKYGISVECASPTSLALLPGARADFVVKVMNEGNGHDLVRMRIAYVEPSPAFTPTFMFDEMPIDEFPFGPFDNARFNVSATVPQGAPAGNYSVSCNITSQGGKFVVLSFNVTILQVHAATVRTLQSVYYSAPGRSVKVTFDLLNKGNGPDHVLLSVTGAESSWIRWHDSCGDNYTLGMGQGKAGVYFYIIVPNGTAPGYRMFDIVASSGGMTIGSGRINLTVELPELKIVSVKHGAAKAGKWLTFEVTLANVARVPAGNVEVELTVDGKTVASDRMDILAPGASHSGALAWLVTAGKHEVVLRLDPSNSIEETNEDNNNATETFNIGSNDEPKRLELTGALVTLALLATVVAILAISIRRTSASLKERQVNEGLENQPGVIVEKPPIDSEAAAELSEYDNATRTRPRIEDEELEKEVENDIGKKEEKERIAPEKETEKEAKDGKEKQVGKGLNGEKKTGWAEEKGNEKDIKKKEDRRSAKKDGKDETPKPETRKDENRSGKESEQDRLKKLKN